MVPAMPGKYGTLAAREKGNRLPRDVVKSRASCARVRRSVALGTFPGAPKREAGEKEEEDEKPGKRRKIRKASERKETARVAPDGRARARSLACTHARSGSFERSGVFIERLIGKEAFLHYPRFDTTEIILRSRVSASTTLCDPSCFVNGNCSSLL